MKKITAAELLKQLQANPEFARAQRDREAHEEEAAARLAVEEAPLLAELAETGIRIDSVWDLVNTAASYAQAIPFLLKHLNKPYSAPFKEGIARALAVPSARDLGWPVLVEEYLKTDVTNKRVKDGLAVALAGASDESVLSDLITLAMDPAQGSSRILLLSGIRRSRQQEATDALEKLVADPELSAEISSWRAPSERSDV